MSNTHPFAKRLAEMRELEVRFSNAGKTIRQFRPDEEIGDFPSLEGIETMHWGDLGVLETQGKIAVMLIERRANGLQAEAEEAERARAENLRRQNMNPLEAKVERLERALAYQGAEIAKLKGVQHGQLPALPHLSRAEVPQFLGMPSGLGRHGVAGPAGSGGGVRKIAGGTPAADAPIESGVTRREHPLNVIGGSGRR
jgi:hypothetical protein